MDNGIREETRVKSKKLTLVASFVVAAVVFIGVLSSVRAADECSCSANRRSNLSIKAWR